MDSKFLRTTGFSLIESVTTMAVSALLISVVIFTAGQSIKAAKAQRTVIELNAIAMACTEYYNETGVWPLSLADLQPKYISAQADNNNPFGYGYDIVSDTRQVIVATLLPAALITDKSFGSEIMVKNQGDNDLVSVTMPITSTNWNLKYDKKHLYGQ